MGILESVNQMKEQGMSEQQIVENLREQNPKISPREINDALNQSSIKNAVSTNPEEDSMMNVPSPQGESQNQEQFYTPQPGAMPQLGQGYAPQGEFYQPASYEDYGGDYGYGAEGFTDSIIDISEQVFYEKIKKIQKKISELNEFKALYQTKIENALERIKRIEIIIDKLQIAILEKIDSYGDTLGAIKKEMSMMQDSFGKIIKTKK